MVIGRKIRGMDMELILGYQEKCILDFGRIIRDMERERTYGPVGRFMMGSG